MQYDHQVALDGTPMADKLGTATVKGCSMRKEDPPSADADVTLYRIRGLDPAVAMGTIGEDGAADSIWIAFDEEPVSYEQLPDKVQQYVEP